MPRSFPFNSYSPQRLDVGRRIKLRQKKKLVESELHEPPPGMPGLHYGNRFAETERLAHEHALHPRPAEPPKLSRSQEELPPLETRAPRGSPIGALPRTEEPFEEPEAVMSPRDFQAVMDDASRSFRRLSGAVKDLSTASRELVRLPVDLARLLGRRRG